MAKQFKKYTAQTTDSTTGELTQVGDRKGSFVSNDVFTYPAEFSHKKVRGLIAAKLNRADDAVFITSIGLVEFE